MTSVSPRYSVVMFAHNEQDNLRRSIPAVYHNCDDRLAAFYLIANGCTDDTVAEAERLRTALDFQAMRVINLALGDKCNAWNTYVHDLANVDVECHFFVDADVRFSEQCFPRLAHRLMATDPAPNIVAGMPLSGRNLGFYEMLVRERSCFFGNLYGMHNNYLKLLHDKSFRLPVGLNWIDSFLTKAANTDLAFTRDNLPGRVVHEEGVGFAFDSLSPWRWSDIRLYRNRIARYELGKLQEHYLDALDVADWPSTMDSINADIWHRFDEVASNLGGLKRYLVRRRLRQLIARATTPPGGR